MAFTGNEDHTDITLAEASAWTKNYRNDNPPNAVLGHYFGKRDIMKIFEQEDCVGMRIYYALDEAGVKQLIIVGVNTDENDLYEGLLAERSYHCPPKCGAINPLNS